MTEKIPAHLSQVDSNGYQIPSELSKDKYQNQNNQSKFGVNMMNKPINGTQLGLNNGHVPNEFINELVNKEKARKKKKKFLKKIPSGLAIIIIVIIIIYLIWKNHELNYKLSINSDQINSENNFTFYLLSKLRKLEVELIEINVERKIKDNDIDILNTKLREMEEELKAIKSFTTSHSDALDITKSQLINLNQNWNSNKDLIPSLKIKAKFLWKIEQFSALLSTGNKGNADAIRSQPFYTDNGFGYKLRLQIFPNGHSHIADNYTSIFFQIEKGEMDSILNWPFNYTWTISLMHRSVNKIYEKAVDLQDSNCGNLLAGYGCGWPKFISHDEIFKSGYVIGDALYVKVIVKEYD